MSDFPASPLNIVFTLPSFAAGGAEHVLITLMNGLDRRRFSPSLVCLNKGGPLRDLVAPDIPVYADHNFRRVVSGLPWLYGTLRRLKPDLVVSTMAHMNFGVLLAGFLLPRQVRIIVREAITPSYLLDTHKHGWLVRILYRFLYPRARQVICPANCIIQEFGECVHMNTHNFALLYNPVNIDKIRAQIAAPSNDAPVHFICAGRLHYQKGFDRLIESLPRLSADKNCRVTILGEGEERRALEQQIEKLGLQDRVILRGFSSAPWPEIASADCFLLPSRHEGLPNVALEALCVGTPVIAMQEAGGIGEIAALAQPGSVTLCRTMDEFITAMENAQTLPRNGMRPSLLPDIFHPATVEMRFMSLMDQATA